MYVHHLVLYIRIQILHCFSQPLISNEGPCLGLCSCLVLFPRFQNLLRFRIFRRLFNDDVLIILAWLILLATVILLLIDRSLELIYIAYRVATDEIEPPACFLQHLMTWNHILLAESCLHLCGLWAVTFSFLALLRRLGYHVKGQKVIWWSVSILTVAGFIISVSVLLSPCGPGRHSNCEYFAIPPGHVVMFDSEV